MEIKLKCKKFFAFLPVKITGTGEWVWFEWVSIERGCDRDGPYKFYRRSP